MYKITPERLDNILAANHRWVATDGREGATAEFVDIDLSGLEFRSRDLTKASFIRCNLSNTAFVGATCTATVFRHCSMTNADFRHVDMDRALINHCSGSSVKFNGANLNQSIIHRCEFLKAVFNEASMCEVGMSNVSALDASFCGADLTRAQLFKTGFTRADFDGANLRDVSAKWCEFNQAKCMHKASIATAEFIDCVGDGWALKTISGLRWLVTIWADKMSIGCQSHSIDDWFAFSDDDIEEMDGYALEWWRKHKEFVRQFTQLGGGHV